MNKSDFSNHLSDAFKQPVMVQQYASSVPDGEKVLVREAEHRFTRNDESRTIDRKMRVGTHMLNPPLTDGLNSVGAIYKALADAAFNYQQEHVTSYYEMFPRLTRVVLTASELAAADSTWLRLNYRMISARVAHRIWHYTQVSTMLAAALINMVNLGRFEGSEVNFKSIASAFRASRINTNTPNYNKFPKVKGVEDYLISNGLYLIGQANDGTPITSIPLYATDIFGNRGWHSVPLSTFSALDGSGVKCEAIPLSQTQAPEDDFLALQFYTAKAAFEYVGEDADFDFRMPQVENAGTYAYKEGEYLASFRSGGGGRVVNPYGANYADGSSFSDVIYRNWKSWSDYITKYFADFADITSDWYHLVTDTLGICEESKTTAQIISTVRGMKYATISDFLSKATFGKSGRATCATIVKYLPYLNGSDQHSEEFVKTNFERYEFWEDDMRYVIRKAKRFPKLTPTLFYTKDSEDVEKVFCANTGPNYPPFNEENSYREGTSPLVYGQRAMYDWIRAVSVDVETDTLVTIGVSAEASRAFATHDTTSKVYDELRDAVFVDVLPLIDDTDPYACGLHYFFAHDSALKAQTEITLADANYGRNRMKAAVLADDVPYVPKFDSDGIVPTSEAYGDDINDSADVPALAAHIINDDYYAAKKHMIAFGGVGICDDIVNASLLQNAGAEFKVLPTNNKLDGLGKVMQDLMNNLTYDVNYRNYPLWVAGLQKDGLPRLHNGEENSFVAFLKLFQMSDTVVSDVEGLVEITFPATYGSIAMCTDPNPLRSIKSVMNILPSNTKPNGGKVPYFQIFVTGYGSIPEANSGSRSGRVNKNLDYFASVEGYSDCIERSVVGISHYVKALIDTSGYTDVVKETYISPVYSPMVDGKLRLMGSVFVKAMGKRNTVAFWDEDHSAIHDLAGVSLAGSVDFKRNDYVAEITTRQRIQTREGFNGTSSKQGDAPKFVASNERRSRGKPHKGNRKRKSSGSRVGGSTPEKPDANPKTSHFGSRAASSSNSDVEKPFMDSMSSMATADQKSEVSKTERGSNLKPGSVEAM